MREKNQNKELEKINDSKTVNIKNISGSNEINKQTSSPSLSSSLSPSTSLSFSQPVLNQTIAQQVHTFYLKHNPTKVDEIPKLLEKYKGQEQELLRKLEKKYGVTSLVSGLSTPIPQEKSGAQNNGTPIDITKSGWGTNIFTTAATPSSLNNGNIGSPSSLFGGQTGNLGMGLIGSGSGGATTPTPFAVPSTGPLWGQNPSTPGNLAGTISPSPFTPFSNNGISSPSLTPSFLGNSPSGGTGFGTNASPIGTGTGLGAGFVSPSTGLFRTTGGTDLNSAVRPPSGMTSVTSTPFGANNSNNNSITGIGGQGGLFGVSGTGGLFSGTKTPPRPVSGFTSVGSSGICFGQNSAGSLGIHFSVENISFVYLY